MNINKQKKPVKKYVLIVLIILAGLGITWAAYVYANKARSPALSDNQTSSNSDSNSINYNPPTEQEIKEGQDAKGSNETKDQETSQPAGSNKTPSDQKKKTVNVGISYADIYDENLEIRAFTNGVIEGTGTCTATATLAGRENIRVTRSDKAFIDTSSTLCQPIFIPVSELRSGTWKISVKFSSPDHEGTSGVVEVKVP